jgi:hypothetical protein
MRTCVLIAVLAATLGLASPARVSGELDDSGSHSSLSATGTIQNVDTATRTLTLRTSRGNESFVVAEYTTIHRGAKVATFQDLGKWSGSPAKVRYTESEGRRTASSVMVGGR